MKCKHNWMQSVSLLFVLPCSGVSDAKPFSRSLKKKKAMKWGVDFQVGKKTLTIFRKTGHVFWRYVLHLINTMNWHWNQILLNHSTSIELYVLLNKRNVFVSLFHSGLFKQLKLFTWHTFLVEVGSDLECAMFCDMCHNWNFLRDNFQCFSVSSCRQFSVSVWPNCVRQTQTPLLFLSCWAINLCPRHPFKWTKDSTQMQQGNICQKGLVIFLFVFLFATFPWWRFLWQSGLGMKRMDLKISMSR